MKHYVFELTPLTPIHIGAGDTLEAYEYVIIDNQLYRFKPEWILGKLNEAEQNQFINLIATHAGKLQQFLQSKHALVTALDPNPIAVAREALSKYQGQLSNPKAEHSIYPFISTSDKPFIPGSSVKGAIRTALLYYLAYVKKNRKPITEKNAQKLEQETFGYKSALEDPFKTLKIGDSEPLPQSTRVELVCVRSRRSARIPTLREVTKSKFSSQTYPKFLLPVEIMDEYTHYVRKMIQLREIISACRQFYDDHLNEEKKRVDELGLTKPASWYQKLIDYETNLAQDSFLIRFGWGSGLDAVTVNYALSEPRKTVSCRVAEDDLPLGWAEIKVVPC